ncbi:hypothetical protein FRB94_010826 [Tulasnella sp. JGI-2019a]|nr:hypothetical protein FRB93_009774 [Tulasnella sp. JGI-2019a]KAG8993372.1 hypothetical protein FRB94_010826 [Tulasnella sp. JGI-2019a]
MAYVHHFDFTAQARRLVFALGVTLVVTPVISLLSFKVFAIVLVNQVVFAWASRSNTASGLGGIPRPSFSAGVAATLFLIVARYLNPAPDIARAIGTPATLSCLHYVLEKRARRELETRDIRTPSEERQHRTAIRFSQWLSSIILHVLGCWSYPSSDLSLLTGFLAVVWTLFEIFQIALGTLQALKEFAKNNDPETIRTTLLHLRRQTGFLVSRWIISILCTFVRRSLQLSIALTTTGTFLVRSNGQVSDALERTLTTHHQLQCLTINFLEKQLAALWILVASGQDTQETEEERNGQISLKLADKDHAELSQDDILFLYKWLPTSRRASFFEAHTLYLMAKSPPPADARIVHEDSLSPAEVGAADLEVNQDHSNPQFDITDPRTITLPLLPISKPIQSRSQRITSFASAEADTPAPSSSTSPDPEFQPLPEPNHAPLLLSKLVFVASAFRRLEYIFRMEPLDSETAAWILTCDHENFCQVVGPRFSVVEERLVTHLAELQSRNNDLDTELADVKAAYDILHSTCADIQRDFVELSACYDALREARQTQVNWEAPTPQHAPASDTGPSSFQFIFSNPSNHETYGTPYGAMDNDRAGPAMAADGFVADSGYAGAAYAESSRMGSQPAFAFGGHSNYWSTETFVPAPFTPQEEEYCGPPAHFGLFPDTEPMWAAPQDSREASPREEDDRYARRASWSSAVFDS